MALLMFGLRDRFGALVVEPMGGVTIGFASREEAEEFAGAEFSVVDLDQIRPPRERRKTVPLPPA
jgi:hypothetical protein